jgi:hypothetical protein
MCVLKKNTSYLLIYIYQASTIFLRCILVVLFFNRKKCGMLKASTFGWVECCFYIFGVNCEESEGESFLCVFLAHKKKLKQEKSILPVDYFCLHNFVHGMWAFLILFNGWKSLLRDEQKTHIAAAMYAMELKNLNTAFCNKKCLQR